MRVVGIDLLKIVAMLGIVMLHIINWSGFGLGREALSAKSILLECLFATCLPAVNCFVMASGWVLVKHEVKFCRLFRLWFLVWFYSLLLLAITLVFFPGTRLKLSDYLASFFPVSCNGYWYFSCYVALFFLMPLLNAAIHHLSRRQITQVLGWGFLFFSCVTFCFYKDPFVVRSGYSVLWFSFLYFFSAAMSEFGFFMKVRTGLLALIAVACIGCTVIGSHISAVIIQRYGFVGRPWDFAAYNSPVLFIESVCFFILFTRISIQSCAIKNLIAFVMPSVFSVYIIHSNGCFRIFSDWNANWTSVLNSLDASGAVLVVILSAITIFCIAIVIDFMRRVMVALLKARGGLTGWK